MPTRPTHACTLLAPLVIAGLVALASASQAAPAPKGPLARLAFISGTWSMQQAGMAIEETWSSAEGPAMVGMMRWERDGKLFLYELMSIETSEDGHPVLRLRHFGAKLEPWQSEQTAPALAFTLSETTDTRAVFEAPERTSPGRIIYEREGDILSVVLQNVDTERKLVNEQGFTLKRVK